ncbi:TM183-like protein [Mya arenaria]|uniref:TM183-like protein n=1 Tax=Mya arenaria TaxID=6604 RepID=A0ABY7DXP3_MYAAR|nr:TM183-like protein [Mya arenaria]
MINKGIDDLTRGENVHLVNACVYKSMRISLELITLLTSGFCCLVTSIPSPYLCSLFSVVGPTLLYYIDETNIPDELRMTSIECIHGLRARTIKMLHFVYPPLVMRTKTSMPFENEPHCLVGQRCLLTWHRKMRNGWKFYLRFRKGDEVDLSSNEQKALKSPGFMKWHQDLFYNPDEGASVLEVTCQNYSPLPMVMGLILNRVYLNVSSGSMRYHRLKLVMDSSYRATTAKNQGSMQELVLDPVLEVKVFPWWHPAFADSQSMLMETEA